MIRNSDFGPVLFGGTVTLANWWDDKRIEDGRIASRDILKKASFYAYLGIGLGATLASVFNWLPRWERWTESVSHGFLYDLPRFALNLTKDMGAGGSNSSDSRAVVEARKILQTKQITAGTAKKTARSYEREFDQVGAF